MKPRRLKKQKSLTMAYESQQYSDFGKFILKYIQGKWFVIQGK